MSKSHVQNFMLNVRISLIECLYVSLTTFFFDKLLKIRFSFRIEMIQRQTFYAFNLTMISLVNVSLHQHWSALAFLKSLFLKKKSLNKCWCVRSKLFSIYSLSLSCIGLLKYLLLWNKRARKHKWKSKSSHTQTKREKQRNLRQGWTERTKKDAFGLFTRANACKDAGRVFLSIDHRYLYRTEGKGKERRLIGKGKLRASCRANVTGKTTSKNEKLNFKTRSWTGVNSHF